MKTAIRLAAESDAGQIQAIYAPIVESTCISFETEAPSIDEMGSRIRSVLQSFPWLVCEQDGAILGYAYAGRHRDRAAYQWSVDVSVYVHPSHHGRGIGQALYGQLLRILAAQGFYNAYAGITLPNAASVRLHEKMGFSWLCTYREVGFKQGAWRDVGWWHLGLRPRHQEPAPPIGIRELSSREMLPGDAG